MIPQSNAAFALRYRFAVSQQPDLHWTVQKVHLPAVAADNVWQLSPFYIIPKPADKMRFGDLQITILVDETMVAYKGIIDWMYAIAPLQGPQDRLSWIANHPHDTVDANLDVLDAHNNPVVRFRFPDIFPTQLDDVQFQTDVHGLPVVTTTITFAVTTMEVTPLST